MDVERLWRKKPIRNPRNTRRRGDHGEDWAELERGLFLRHRGHKQREKKLLNQKVNDLGDGGGQGRSISGDVSNKALSQGEWEKNQASEAWFQGLATDGSGRTEVRNKLAYQKKE